LLNCRQQISYTMPAVQNTPELIEYVHLNSLWTLLCCSNQQTIVISKYPAIVHFCTAGGTVNVMQHRLNILKISILNISVGDWDRCGIPVQLSWSRIPIQRCLIFIIAAANKEFQMTMAKFFPVSNLTVKNECMHL